MRRINFVTDHNEMRFFIGEFYEHQIIINLILLTFSWEALIYFLYKIILISSIIYIIKLNLKQFNFRMNKITNILKRETQQNVSNRLPAHFAEEVLNLELQIQANSTLDIQTIHRLIQLYSIAVEYYQSIKSNKYLIFKNKITNLLLKPSVNHALEITTNQKNGFEDKQITESNQNILKKKELEQNLIYALHNTEGEVKSIIRNANDRYDSIYKIINNGIFMQEFHLRERLKSRKGKKNQILSRQSTEGDPKQSEIQDMKTFDVIEENYQSIKLEESGVISRITANQHKQQVTNLVNDLPGNQLKKFQQVPIQQNKQLIKQKTKKEPESNIEEKQVTKKNKNQKKVFTLKSNKKKQDIPAQYIIPF